jgi:hypothetical protein
VVIVREVGSERTLPPLTCIGEGSLGVSCKDEREMSGIGNCCSTLQGRARRLMYELM